MTGLRSARERYAQAATDHMDQARDAKELQKNKP